ncbi:unnamed protein product [Arabis nemorensis]|uniref:TF-B3 domain-containing protein n=1 Tax=Arabis nemorensis TaxID=586526 RepID=A0A565C5M5_9BRAS|nr:unnamed protein product [Arabis nemorensis]
MAKSTLRHPQFFHTLVPGFHTHLIIPVDFFCKYIQVKGVEDTAELKSDSSDITWKVKMSGRRLSDGWKEFAVANNLQIGDVLLVRYEGDLVFFVSDLGPNCSETRDIAPPPTPSNNNVVQGVIELPRKKKLKKKSPETEAGSSSSSDKSCFVAIVTASSLRTDTLYLPQYFTNSNGLTRKCCKIVLIDGGERSWALDLRFNNSSDTFYISRGWRNFCDENGQKAGGFFMFKLVGSGETPVLSFCPTESYNDRKQRDCAEASGRESLSPEVSCEEENIEVIEIESSEDECSLMESLLEIEKTKYSPKRKVLSYSSYSPCHKRLVTFALPPDYIRIRRLTLPMPFLRENDISKPGEIYLLGKDGTKWLTNLLLDKKGSMRLGKGWKEFVKANGVKTGFTLKLIWEDTTPVFSLCDVESTIDREQEEFSKSNEKESLFVDPSKSDKINKDENNKEESRSWERNKNYLRGKDSTPSKDQLVKLTITPASVRKCRLGLSKCFTKENDISKPGMITLSGKDGIKHETKLLLEKRRGAMALGDGWKSFVNENGLKTGDSFTLKLVWEDSTPVLSLFPAERSIGKGGGGCSETNQKKSLPIEPSSYKKISKDEDINDDNSKEKNNNEENSKEENKSVEREKTHLRGRDSTPPSQKQFVTIKITPSSFRNCRLILPAQFVRENSMNKPGIIYLVGKDGTRWLTNLLRDKKGTMSLGNGWKDFGVAHDLKSRESFTMELIWEEATPILSWARTESCISKANEKESVSTEPRSRDSSSATQNQFVTLALTPEDVRACQLHLPSQFMKANGINKLGRITLLGENGMEWSAYLLSKDGTVALGNGWDEFCEANGVNLGESFTLQFFSEQDKTSPVLKFCSRENKYKNVK